MVMMMAYITEISE